MERPTTRYAKTPDGVQLAYQVFGEGPRDLVLVWGGISHIDLFWDDPTIVRILRRFGSIARVIQFDRRGTGMSDRSGVATLDERMEDVRVVMDAAGCERAAIFGESEGAPMSCLFAATYPERTTALILYGPVIRMVGDRDYPWAQAGDVFEGALDFAVDEWGSEDLIWGWAPSVGDDPRAREFFSRFMRMSSSPGAYRAQMLANAAIDVRPILSSISAPTLVLHRKEDMAINVGQGRYAAGHIPDARFVELQGEDHLLIGGDPIPLCDEVEEFLTGVRGARDVDRALMTLVFVDIVGSTPLASRLGDRRWREVLDQHDLILRRELGRFGGRVVNMTGDGMVAAFDRPVRAVAWAHSVLDAVRPLDIELRAGVHTGECELRGHDVAGMTVHVAARIGALASASEVLVSEVVRDLVADSGLVVTDRGEHPLKGVDGQWRLAAVDRPTRSPGDP